MDPVAVGTPPIRQCHVCHYAPSRQRRASPSSTEAVVPVLKRCQRCQSIYYCSVVCQKRDWKRHRHVCRRISDVATVVPEKGSHKGDGCDQDNGNVRVVYHELLQILNDKPLQQLQQECTQISDYIKERQTLSTSSASTNHEKLDHEWLLAGHETTSSSSSLPVASSSAVSSTIEGNFYDNKGMVEDNVCPTMLNDAGIGDRYIEADIKEKLQSWKPVPCRSQPHTETSASLPSLSWNIYLEYMQSLRCIQIIFRPETSKKYTRKTDDSPSASLKMDNVRVSFDIQRELPRLQSDVTNRDHNTNHVMGRVSDIDTTTTSTTLIYEYIDNNVTGDNYCDLSTLLRLRLKLPTSFLREDSLNDCAKPLRTVQQPLPQYTMSLVDNNTAISLRLTFDSVNDDLLHYSNRYPFRDMDEFGGYTGDDDDDVPQLQLEEYCLGCRHCHTPFIPLLLSSLRSAVSSKSTATSESKDDNGSITETYEDGVINRRSAIHHIFPLPTGHLNELHDYLICYNDGPTNVNFDAYNLPRDIIPPTGVMYENDIAYTVSEIDVFKDSLCTLSIPEYGRVSSDDLKNGNNSIPLDILHQSQVWQCHSLPIATKLDDSPHHPMTVTCSVCATIVGYKVVSEESVIPFTGKNANTNPDTIAAGYHLLKHKMILLQKQIRTLSLPIQTQSPKNDTVEQTMNAQIPAAYKHILSPTLGQFVIYEMIHIAETKGIFTFVICKNCPDITFDGREYAAGKKLDGRTTSAVGLKLRLLNWNSIVATCDDTFLPKVVSELTNAGAPPVCIPVWKQCAKVYFETIVVDDTDGVMYASATQDVQRQSVKFDAANSFRNQFLKRHNAWCCRDNTSTTGSDSKEVSGIFMNGVVTTDTILSSNEDNNTDEIIDATMIRLYLSLCEFDVLLDELQESSRLNSQEVVHAIRSSLTSGNDESYSDINTGTTGLASITL